MIVNEIDFEANLQHFQDYSVLVCERRRVVSDSFSLTIRFIMKDMEVRQKCFSGLKLIYERLTNYDFQNNRRWRVSFWVEIVKRKPSPFYTGL